MFGFAQFWKKNADKWYYLCIYSLANRGITCCKWLRKPWLRLFPVTCDLSLSLPSKRQKIISVHSELFSLCWSLLVLLLNEKWGRGLLPTARLIRLGHCYKNSPLLVSVALLVISWSRRQWSMLLWIWPLCSLSTPLPCSHNFTQSNKWAEHTVLCVFIDVFCQLFAWWESQVPRGVRWNTCILCGSLGAKLYITNLHRDPVTLLQPPTFSSKAEKEPV